MALRAKQKSQAKQSNQPDNPTEQTFIEHLHELRSRVFWIVLTLVLATVVGLQIKDWLINVVMAPLHGQQLIYLTPGGGFSFIFTVSLYFGALLTIPIAILQLFRFLQPMLPRTSRKFVVTLISVSALLAATGAALAYFLAVPAALGFLDEFSGNSIVASLTADSYLNFVVMYVVGLAALFQLPLLLFLYDHIKPIPPGNLARSQRYAIVAMTIFAALITPSPDLLSFAIVLIPILAIYEIGVLTVYVRRKLRKSKAEEISVVESVEIPEAVVAAVAANEIEPLTAIVKEAAKEEEPEKPETAIVVEEPPKEIVQIVVPTQIPPVVPVKQETPPIQPAKQELKPRSRRSIDGMIIAHKTNVQLVQNSIVQKQQKINRKSIDGVLTVQARA